MSDGCVLAVGGHLLDAPPPWTPTVPAALQHLVVALAHGGAPLVIAHGNGPQVAGEAAPAVDDGLPLDARVAQTQGEMGYRLQHALGAALRAAGVDRPVVALVTRVEVAGLARAPRKPVGPPLDGTALTRLAAAGTAVMEDPPRGWRRAVPSPRPVAVCEAAVVRDLAARGAIVIAGGGGGIPVIRTASGGLVGVAAVVDKDWTATLLAQAIGATVVLNLTSVPAVMEGFGTPASRPVPVLRPEDARRLLAGQALGPGSMRPKVAAALAFVEAGGQRVVITDLAHATAALGGEAGTTVLA